MRRSPFAILGAAGVGLGCAAMVSMLPAAAASVVGALGITASGGLARTLSPVAEPLFIASAALLVLAALTCSRLVVALTSAGAVLLYLSMFQLATSPPSGGGGSMSMMAMQHSDRAPAAMHADAATFYLGLTLLVGAAALGAWRRHRNACRPLLRMPQLRAARR